MFPLHIRMKKCTDGRLAQSCTRVDGSVTWQRMREGYAPFFIRHDLTHVAVESVLRHRQGFYGLLASGWDYSDFAEKWSRERYPADADPSELFVGLLDAEHASGVTWSAAEFNGHATRFMHSQGAPACPAVTDEDLIAIRSRLAELLAQWAAVPSGEVLEIAFDPQQDPRAGD